jgi:crossover junction endodeoxyribonuclease RuvC
MAVIGIDPGTALTGYGIVEENSNGELITLGFGVIETSKNDTSHNRLLTIYTELEDVLSLYRPESSAVERLFFQKNTKTALAVGQARGVILLSLAKAGIEISEYNPVEIKQAITGYGQASKKQIQEMVKILLRLDSIPQPDDAADALAIAICHIHSRKMASLV